ncbi:MAG: FAD-dependent oxidoreductase [Actinobacteria bacterium]|nr:FAD-dependent oxidoreductase [Actinomycetota bacterium]
MADVAVVGGGISGIACARSLADAGFTVDVIDRGQRLGGRLAVQTLRDTGTACDGRVVDVGAAYLTVSDPAFAAVVDDWVDRGTARPWTDTFHVADGTGLLGTKLGPMRYAAPRGLRSLVEDLAVELPSDLVSIAHPMDVDSVIVGPNGVDIADTTYRAVALCGPDPQMRSLLHADTKARDVLAAAPMWEPVIALTAVYDKRTWADLDAAFVNDDPVLSFVADDGRRRGDDAPVLVAHSTPILAAGHLADPVTAAPLMLGALERIVAGSEPAWFSVKRWTYARPARARDDLCFFDGAVGLAGDAWAGRPRTEAAWLSGTALGRRMAEALTA